MNNDNDEKAFEEWVNALCEKYKTKFRAFPIGKEGFLAACELKNARIENLELEQVRYTEILQEEFGKVIKDLEKEQDGARELCNQRGDEIVQLRKEREELKKSNQKRIIEHDATKKRMFNEIKELLGMAFYDMTGEDYGRITELREKYHLDAEGEK